VMAKAHIAFDKVS